MKDFQGKVLFITGGASGAGFGQAKVFSDIQPSASGLVYAKSNENCGRPTRASRFLIRHGARDAC